MMMSHYFAGDAPWIVAALLLAVICLFLRRLVPTKAGGPSHSARLALRRWPDPK